LINLADVLPINFPVPSESSIASYDYTDIAEGTGVVVFQGVNTQDNAVQDYSLITNTIYSTNKFTYGTSGPNAKAIDIDFDVTFNNPKNIKGIARGQVSWLQGDETVANKSGDSYAIMKIRKYSGTTETEIASNTKSKSLVAADTTVNGTTVMIEANISSVVHFKAGDILRVTIEIWGGSTVNGAVGTSLWLCHDPADRAITQADLSQGAALTGNVTTSQLKIQIPFRLDL
jgi:hypothetical protein